MQGKLTLKSKLRTKLIKAPGPGRAYKVRNLHNIWRGWWKWTLARKLKIPTLYGQLYAVLIRADGSKIYYGLISTRLITTAFVNFMVDQLQTETSEWGDFKYHDSGVGVTGANITDTDIETTDGESRVAGTQTEGASANIYKSVATIAYTTTKIITEFGLFSKSTGTTLLDRHTFGALNVVNGDSVEFTYEITVSAGG